MCAPLIAIPIVWRLLRTPTAWLALFLGCALLTPPLPIPLGDSGPHVAIAIAGAGLFIGLLRLGEWRFQPDALALSLIALWSIFACSIAMAAVYSGIAIAAGSLARVLLFGISIYVFLYVRDGPGRLTMRASLRGIRWLFWAGALSALYACVDFYFQFSPPAGYEQQFVWLESGVYRRAQGFFYEASTLGNLCAFFLEMVAVALLLRKDEQSVDQPVSRLALFLGAAPLAAALVLSFSRASLVNLAVALLALGLAASRSDSLASNGGWDRGLWNGSRRRFVGRVPGIRADARGCEYRLHSSISRNRRMRCSPAASMRGER